MNQAETLIPNWLGNDPLEVSHWTQDRIGPLVSLIQSSGSLRFQHSMKPEQARAMAAALIEHANAVEKEAAA